MGLFKKGTKLYSIANLKCPHCHEGDFFVAHPYNLKHVGDNHKRCPVCDRRLEREVGFYYGAMYVSYGLGVATFVTIWVAVSVLFPESSATTKVIAIASGILLLGPYLYALSKIIWANMFFPYKGVELLPEELEEIAQKERELQQAQSSKS